MTAARISAADFVQMKGFGLALWVSIKARMSCLQLSRRGMHPPAELLTRQVGEPAFHLVEPGGRGRGAVHLIVRPLRQPRRDRSGLVGGVVVHDDVDGQPCGDAGINLLQEGEELPGAMPLVAFADDEAGGDVEGREQRGMSRAGYRNAYAARRCLAASATPAACGQGPGSGSFRPHKVTTARSGGAR